jgi:hypothetical protein
MNTGRFCPECSKNLLKIFIEKEYLDSLNKMILLIKNEYRNATNNQFIETNTKETSSVKKKKEIKWNISKIKTLTVLTLVIILGIYMSLATNNILAFFSVFGSFGVLLGLGIITKISESLKFFRKSLDLFCFESFLTNSKSKTKPF